MNTEELLREVISKSCPFHGKRPNVEIDKAGQMKISTCCQEFRDQISAIENYMRQKSIPENSISAAANIPA